MAIKNIINLVELYTDAKIDFDDFMVEVLGHIQQVSRSDIRAMLSQLELDTIPEEKENSSNNNMSNITSSKNPSFILKECSSNHSNQFIYKSNSDTFENSLPSKSETGSNNTFKEYILDKTIKESCKHDVPIGRVR